MSIVKPMLAAAALAMLPSVALAAGAIETALAQGQAAITGLLAAAIVGTAFGFITSRVDARAREGKAKAPEDRNLIDKMAIEADRRLDEIDRGHLQVIVDNVLTARLDKVAATIGIPPIVAADDFVDDFFTALRTRNPGLATRLPIDENAVKDLIAAGIGRITAPDVLAEALRKIPGVGDVRSVGAQV